MSFPNNLELGDMPFGQVLTGSSGEGTDRYGDLDREPA